MDPGWVIWEEFWLETVMVRCPGDQVEFLLGGQQKGVTRSTRQVRGQGMCGLGVWWAWWTSGSSEVSKPSFLAHSQRDAHAEG